MLAPGIRVVMRRVVIQQLDIGDQRGASVQALKKIVAQHQILRHPPGKRGFLFSKYVYEEQLKLKTAHRLDKIKEARDQRSQKIAKDPELQRFVRENSTQVREILLQLDAPKTALFRGKLQRELASIAARTDRRVAAERKRRWKQHSRSIRKAKW